MKRDGVCRMAGDKSTSDARRAGGVKGGGAATLETIAAS
jgi:hypothetical protein